MANTLEHLYGSQICVIDTETTGLDSHFHEILQICILPLNSNLDPRKDVLPFFIDLKPDCPERIDPEALKINKIDLHNVMMRGFDHEKAKDMLRDWIPKLGLPISKLGNPCKIVPLGQNYAFDRDFIMRWLGPEMYNEFLDYHFRDTMVAANYLNDRAVMHAERAPYKRVNLTALATTHKIEYETKHNALSDCLCTAAVYKKMIQQGLLG